MVNAEQAKGMAMMMIEGLKQEFAITRKVLAALPDGQEEFNIGGEKGKSALELLWHIVSSEIWFANGIAALDFGGGDESSVQKPATKAEMLALFDTAVPAGMDKVAAMSGDALASPIDFFGAMKLPAVMYLDFWKVHSVHHRGQFSTYLRAMGAKVPSIYGGSYDEPFQAPATA